jgi:hypothetical protein
MKISRRANVRRLFILLIIIVSAAVHYMRAQPKMSWKLLIII